MDNFYYFFCACPYSVPIIGILLFRAVFVSPYNSFLCFLTINEDSHKTKDWFGHMQTPQITHRTKGLWQGFPCHHTNNIYMLLSNGLCKHNKSKLQRTFSWHSWEHRQTASWKAIFTVHEFPGGLALACPQSGQLLFCSHGKCVGCNSFATENHSEIS